MTSQQLFPDIPTSTVEEVFHYWAMTHGKRRALLSPERHRVITKALKLYSVDDIRQAIDGCALSPWHMGQNPSRKKYNDISLILRDAAHIENFAELADNHNTAGGFLDE